MDRCEPQLATAVPARSRESGGSNHAVRRPDRRVVYTSPIRKENTTTTRQNAEERKERTKEQSMASSDLQKKTAKNVNGKVRGHKTAHWKRACRHESVKKLRLTGFSVKMTCAIGEEDTTLRKFWLFFYSFLSIVPSFFCSFARRPFFPPQSPLHLPSFFLFFFSLFPYPLSLIVVDCRRLSSILPPLFPSLTNMSDASIPGLVLLFVFYFSFFFGSFLVARRTGLYISVAVLDFASLCFFLSPVFDNFTHQLFPSWL